MTNKQPTAEDLVRAILEGGPFDMATSMGWNDIDSYTDDEARVSAILFIANLITLPEPTDNEIVWRDGAPLYFRADYQGNENE